MICAVARARDGRYLLVAAIVVEVLAIIVVSAAVLYAAFRRRDWI